MDIIFIIINFIKLTLLILKLSYGLPFELISIMIEGFEIILNLKNNI
jgi:hypothetical protein